MGKNQYNIATLKQVLQERNGRRLLRRSVQWPKLKRNRMEADDKMNIYCFSVAKCVV